MFIQCKLTRVRIVNCVSDFTFVFVYVTAMSIILLCINTTYSIDINILLSLCYWVCKVSWRCISLKKSGRETVAFPKLCLTATLTHKAISYKLRHRPSCSFCKFAVRVRGITCYQNWSYKLQAINSSLSLSLMTMIYDLPTVIIISYELSA